MSRIFNPTKNYSVLDDKIPEDGHLSDATTTNAKCRCSTTILINNWVGCLLATVISLSTVASLLTFFGLSPYQSIAVNHDRVSQDVSAYQIIGCEPAIRQEWRTLSAEQKLDYITAVQCLASTPSILHPNVSLYDDFPWVHKHLADKTHLSAAFLPWHREYIHIYERTLKEQCGMQGNLPYWDWSLDCADPSAAPVWDNELGLGGDGDLNGPETIGNGRCVTSGPFASFEPKYFDGEYQPHCLSRGFPSRTELQKLGELVQPSAIESMMQEPRYSDFAHQLEKRAHHFLSHSIRGDLSRFTGPNDPVFFLHHANIDRLWWKWQQANPESRTHAYDGQVFGGEAKLTDIMDMAGLGSNLPVVYVMQTESWRFCYAY